MTSGIGLELNKNRPTYYWNPADINSNIDWISQYRKLCMLTLNDKCSLYNHWQFYTDVECYIIRHILFLVWKVISVIGTAQSESQFKSQMGFLMSIKILNWNFVWNMSHSRDIFLV